MRLAVKLFAIALALGLIIVVFRFTFLLSAKDPNTTATQTVEIKANSTRAEVAKQLDDAKLIKSPAAFLLYSRLTRADFIPGPYELSANESASEMILMMSHGDFKTVKITLLEGWRAKDMEKYLVEDRGLKQFVGFTAVAEKDEGYLFPDTYEIKADETIAGLIKILKDNFTSRTKDLKNLTPDVVILASIVEREAGANDDRSQIASVYVNRLKIGMKLQADPTVQYAKGSWAVLDAGDVQTVASPYNTYLNAGLPPGPICNPGLKSLQAALAPATTNYYFFFTAHGTTYYSQTAAEQATKVKKYF
ncbi:MAG TPA: endolytic transglycosylase MltG [Candidatus Saccharimonadales bacterium]|nr:endolytic transglycosylase MltG [Candidatus Saccharimonadales bacterium]